MDKKRRSFLMAFASSMSVGLAGCSSSDDETPTETDTPEPTDTPTSTETETEPEEEEPFWKELVLSIDESVSGTVDGASWSGHRGGNPRYITPQNSGPTSSEPVIRWATERDVNTLDEMSLGYTEPVVVDGKVFHGDASCFAVDEETGNLLWENEEFSDIGEFYDGLLYVWGGEDTVLAGLNPETGDVEERIPNPFNNHPDFFTVTRPTFYDGSVFVASGRQLARISLEKKTVEWTASCINGQKPENRNKGFDKDNRWVTSPSVHTGTDTVLLTDSTGFVYAIDGESGEREWARTFSKGDDYAQPVHGGEKIYQGAEFYESPPPSVISVSGTPVVIHKIGGMKVQDGNSSTMRTLLGTRIGDGEQALYNLPAREGDAADIQSREGVYIKKDGLDEDAFENNMNYIDIDDEKRILFRDGAVLYGFDSTESVFQKHYVDEFGGEILSFASGKENIYYLVSIDGEGTEFSRVPMVVAVDKASFETVWRGVVPEDVRQLSVANGTVYACGKNLYAIQSRS